MSNAHPGLLYCDGKERATLKDGVVIFERHAESTDALGVVTSRWSRTFPTHQHQIEFLTEALIVALAEGALQ